MDSPVGLPASDGSSPPAAEDSPKPDAKDGAPADIDSGMRTSGHGSSSNRSADEDRSRPAAEDSSGSAAADISRAAAAATEGSSKPVTGAVVPTAANSSMSHNKDTDLPDSYTGSVEAQDSSKQAAAGGSRTPAMLGSGRPATETNLGRAVADDGRQADADNSMPETVSDDSVTESAGATPQHPSAPLSEGADVALLPGDDGDSLDDSLSDAVVSTMTRRLAHADSSGSSKSSSSSSSDSSTTCKLCTGVGPHAGRWVARPDADFKLLASALGALKDTCIFRSMNSTQPYFHCPLALQQLSTPDVEDSAVLEWLPYGCRYRRNTQARGVQCKRVYQQQQPEKKLCFLGDSQTRHLYNQVLHLLEGPKAGYKNQVTGFTRAYQVLKSDVMIYAQDNYSNDTALRLNSSGCSHVFVNSGQWAVSHSEVQPWTAKRYAHQVQKLVVRMKLEQKRYGNMQYWLTTNPMPLTDYHQQKSPHGKGDDHRTDPFYLLYNKVATTVMAAHGIPVVDTGSVAHSLSDASYDAAHYIGILGLAQAGMIVNLICGELLH